MLLHSLQVKPRSSRQRCGYISVGVECYGGEYGIPGLTGISNWLDELFSRYVGYNSQSIRDQFMYLRLIFLFLPTINVVP